MLKLLKKGQIKGKNKDILENVDDKFLKENISNIKEFLDVIEKK